MTTSQHHTSVSLETLILARGAHADRSDGLCLLEAAAWQAGEPHTDHPACVSPVLGSFGRSLNDGLPDATRQQLLPLVPLLPGTAGDGLDEQRGYVALDWLVRTYLPTWLRLAGLDDEARDVGDLPRIADLAAARAAGPVVRRAADRAFAAWAAARDAAGAAARAAAWDALAPTIASLQSSAITLYQAMIHP